MTSLVRLLIITALLALFGWALGWTVGTFILEFL